MFTDGEKKSSRQSIQKTKGYSEKDNVISSKVTEMSSSKKPSAMDKIKGMVSKGDKKDTYDEGGMEDLKEIGTNIASMSDGNPRWQAFISPYNIMFTEEILTTEIEKTTEMIGFNKKAEEFLKNNIDSTVVRISEIELKGKMVKLKEVGDSITRRVAKMTSYWKKGNKKNSLFVACMVNYSHVGWSIYECLCQIQVLLLHLHSSFVGPRRLCEIS